MRSTEKKRKLDDKESENTEKKKRKRIILYFLVVWVLTVLFAVSTFAWFSLTRTPRVSNMSIYVNAATGMEIALDYDSLEWGQHLNYNDMVSEMAPLRPVTWSEKDKMFYAALYGVDGRQRGDWAPLSDEMNANRDDYAGYYCVGTFYARTDDNVSVSLSPAIATVDGTGGSGSYLIGTPTWDSEGLNHGSGAEGAENAIRVGIKITRLDATGEPTDDDPLFYIYEPNANAHLNGVEGYVTTPSIDGTRTLVPEERIITQSATSWEESDPEEIGRIIYTFGEFTSDNHLYDMSAGEKVKIQIYVWLEGQDIDCNNMLKETKITANIQFDSISKVVSGIE